MAKFSAPTEAQQFLRRKKLVETESWKDLSSAEHAHAFTVAHSVKAHILEDTHRLLQKAQDEGMSFAQFKKAYIPAMKKRGWYGGRADKIGNERYLNWRSKVIFQTNIRSAQAAGNYRQQLRAAEFLPMWVYKSLLVGDRRDDHLRLHNTARRSEDPFWDEFYPPNGWGCGCYVVAVSEEDAAQKYAISSGEPPPEFVHSVVPEWRTNPGLHAFAPDFSKFSALQKAGALKAVKQAYVKDIATCVLTRGELKKVLRTLDGTKKQAQGLQFPVGALDVKKLDAFEHAGFAIDPKIMVADKQLVHMFRDTKTPGARIEKKHYDAFIDSIQNQERIVQVRDEHGYTAFRFLRSINAEQTVSTVFFLSRDKRSLIFRTAGLRAKTGEKSDVISEIWKK